MQSETSSSSQEWAHRLFQASPLKRRKLDMLRLHMDPPETRRSLDIGSDNGVVSLMLRKMGGEWASADLEETTVTSIRELVQSEVYQVNGEQFPFAAESFDQVLIVDFLEHIEHDRACLREIHRILKPQGIVVINVPNPKDGFLRTLRYSLGQTDQRHGHLRPGYSLAQIKELLGDMYTVERSMAYSRIFSEIVDTCIVGALDLLKGASHGKKGGVVRGGDFQKIKKTFALYQVLAPLFRLMVWFDSLFPFLRGNMLIVRARKL